MESISSKTVKKLLRHADIKINGNRPWDIKVHNKDFYKKVFAQRSIGLGESYVDGWWDSKKLDQFFYKIFYAELNRKLFSTSFILNILKSKIFNMQSTSRAFQIGEKHYDKGNDLYKAMLDKRLTYSCGYWKKAKNLDQAQEAKLDLICRKINLKKGQKILDIGCGWGSFAKYAAEKYKVKVVGLTVSKEQAKLAKKLCKGLPVEIRLQDYRKINEKFDHIVSVGMFEHVGVKNYRKFMEIVHKLLKDDGLFLLHTIGGNRSVTSIDPWIGKYIFPNTMVPSIKQIGKSIENLFVMEDLHNFSTDYDKTLMEWIKNFKKNWNKIKGNYDERFYRMWKYYLSVAAGSFRARTHQLWQIVLSKKGVPEGYTSVR